MENLTVSFRLTKREARELERLAIRKRLKRDRAAREIFREALRRENVHEYVLQEMARRQASSEWKKTFERIEKFRAKVRPIPEAELDADIEAAIRAVRKKTQNVADGFARTIPSRRFSKNSFRT